jgi:hypothetical protein
MVLFQNASIVRVNAVGALRGLAPAEGVAAYGALRGALLSAKPIRNAARLLALLNTPRHSRVGGNFPRRVYELLWNTTKICFVLKRKKNYV